MAGKEDSGLDLTSRCVEEQETGGHHRLTSCRYWGASILTIPHVMLRYIQSGGHSRDAYSWHESEQGLPPSRGTLAHRIRQPVHCYGKSQISP